MSEAQNANIIRRELWAACSSSDAAVAAQQRLIDQYGEDLVIDVMLAVLAEGERERGDV